MKQFVRSTEEKWPYTIFFESHFLFLSWLPFPSTIFITSYTIVSFTSICLSHMFLTCLGISFPPFLPHPLPPLPYLTMGSRCTFTVYTFFTFLFCSFCFIQSRPSSFSSFIWVLILLLYILHFSFCHFFARIPLSYLFALPLPFSCDILYL